ncbi:MAG TPA: winged helix-turn-helix domain-containing protein [Pyrinomonadaceae bacterium]|nr:winged helix-turn-helix domain-containing protein [Pyrinomonadaceae bacterium]
MNKPASQIYEFDEFRLDATERILLRRGELVPLTPRVFDTLLYLVQHHGKVLEKNELMAQIWPDAIVEENNLNQNISTLRRVFGETRGGNRYIVTVPGRGYRFAATVTDNAGRDIPQANAPQTIAVLPFVNMSADPENVYFCEGLAEELLNALSRIEGIKVAARTSAFAFAGKNANVNEIGAALGVKSILEGSVRRSGNRLRITAQLANAADGYQLWSERYDREMRDIFDVQDEITLAVVGALKVKLLGKEKAALLKRYTESTEAYHLYLKGRYFWFKSTPEQFRKSRDYFQRAVDADPAYTLGYFGLASYYGFASSWGMMRPEEGWPKMEAATMKALELDDTLAEVHHGLAALKWVYYRDWSGADQSFRQAIELDPSIGPIHSHYSIFLSVIGKFHEAIAEGKLALELDPLSLRLHRNQAARFYLARRYDDAVRQYREALELEPGDASLHEELGDVYGQMGLHFEAIAEWLKATTLSGDKELAEILQQEDDYANAVQAIAQTRLKRLNARIDRGDFVPAVFIARAYIRLGDIDQAFRWLEKSRDERNAYSLLMNIDPFYDRFRNDPRFVAILKSMNLG